MLHAYAWSRLPFVADLLLPAATVPCVALDELGIWDRIWCQRSFACVCVRVGVGEGCVSCCKALLVDDRPPRSWRLVFAAFYATLGSGSQRFAFRCVSVLRATQL
jgi:hypothetical protein